jgi:serine/threonine protein kinase
MDHTATDPITAPVQRISFGKMLGRFELRGELGAGGMGVVYEAFDAELQRTVALKVLAASDADRAKLLREARAMARLSHPNVITIFDVGTDAGRDFIAMERIDGGTLGTWLAGARGWRAIVRAFIDAGRGLAAAHDAGLVHRDFKPSNVLRTDGGRIVVTDFGLARGLDEDRGGVAGTPGYMAPEQWRGEAASPASDQFAYCVALWEALAGSPPFDVPTKRTNAATTRQPPERAAIARPCIDRDGGPVGGRSIPRSLRAILARGMAEEPAARWPDLDVLVGALERALGFRRRAALASTAAAIAGALALAIAVPRSAADNSTPPAIDPARAWSLPRAAAIAAIDPQLAAVFDDHVARWTAGRTAALHDDPATRTMRLACYDAVLQRLDIAIGSIVRDDTARVNATGPIVDPAACASDPVPRLVLLTPDAAAMLDQTNRGERGQGVDEAAIARAATSPDPCTRILAAAASWSHVSAQPSLASADLSRTADVATIQREATACGDDALEITMSLGVMVVGGSAEAEARVEQLVARLHDDVLAADLDEYRARLAVNRRDWNAAIAQLEHAMELLDRRHATLERANVASSLQETLAGRGGPGDDLRVIALATRWRSEAAVLRRTSLDTLAARARWWLGDAAGADAILEALPATFAIPVTTAPIEGVVIDENGQPVASAEVVTSNQYAAFDGPGSHPRWSMVQSDRRARTGAADLGSSTPARTCWLASAIASAPRRGGLAPHASSFTPHAI